MRPNRALLATALTALTLLGAGCAAPPVPARTVGGPAGPVLRNCGLDVPAAPAPQRVYAAYQPAVEMAHALGVGDRLVGSAYLDAQVLPEYAAAQATVPYTAQLPGREALLATAPDLVLSGYNDIFAPGGDGGSGGFGTRASLGALGVRTWIFSPLCPTADGLSDEAIDPASVTVDAVYADLRDLGALFGAPERAADVEADLRARLAAVRERVAGAPEVSVAVLLLGDDGTLRVAGGPDFVTRVLEIAGARNVFADLTSGRHVPIGAEELIARDPDVVLTSTCCGAAYTAADAAPDVARITGNPAFANLRAVRDGRVLPFLFADRAAGVRAAHSAELVASLVHPGR